MADRYLDRHHRDVLANAASGTLSKRHPCRLRLRRRVVPALRDEGKWRLEVGWFAVHRVWLGGDDGTSRDVLVENAGAADGDNTGFRGRDG